jgi:hypothetical protein
VTQGLEYANEMVSIEITGHEICSPDEREYWDGAMEGRARSSGLAVTAVREKFASEIDLQQMATAWRT